MTRLFSTLAAVAFAAASPLASAGILGTPVEGFISFNGGSTNYFNSSNGFVPGGCQNSGTGSTTVTVVNPGAEFCFADGLNTDTANFTDNTLTYTDVSGGGTASTLLRFTFAPGLVTGVLELSDNFLNGGATASFAGNVLTINIATFNPAGSYSASYSLLSAPAAVPEPSTLALLGAVGVAAAAVARRRRAGKPG
ncbi:PEP-CTERM sorting domain-containing protein [Piscinibacter koreensis]|uniref:PEP-CTERM sorting domain-containing protein n=1 Tax=Piscinibacter koreensis TaxID=2742824 RepID=A0A7Y6TWV6_9BURK|nr:PEP-CTERM sorting domain-containing protein [Schlegelella koreensis]NUZ06544.1 PEP-CTERM sorting domain-containing protein [Schlegelella koreensis]